MSVVDWLVVGSAAATFVALVVSAWVGWRRHTRWCD